MALTDTQFAELSALMLQASNADLDRTFQIFKHRRNVLAQSAAAQFAPGEKVSFPNKQGITVTGFIQKVNRKTVAIKGDDGINWRVTPNFLTKV